MPREIRPLERLAVRGDDVGRAAVGGPVLVNNEAHRTNYHPHEMWAGREYASSLSPDLAAVDVSATAKVGHEHRRSSDRATEAFRDRCCTQAAKIR